MANSQINGIGSSQNIEITDALVEKVSDLVHKIAGIQLGANQRSMVRSRLTKRLVELKMSKSEDYLAYLLKNEVTETRALVSLLTTHHTYFFREFSHFEHLQSKILPRAIEDARARGDKKVRIWSAACSRGQEVYSLSMFLSSCLKTMAPDCTYEVLGTDVDEESVRIAQNGVYLWDEIKEAPLQFITGNWARGTGDISHYVKAKASIKSSCQFKAANLFQLPTPEKFGKFDAIFCRNVFIYFDARQIQDVTKKLMTFLQPRGALIIGVSESLVGMNLPLAVEGPSVYLRKEVKESLRPPATVSPLPTAGKGRSTATEASSAPPAKIRVLCVDDSTSILTLLKKVLAPEFGFEIVGTAKNGIEAKAKVAELKPDVLTLDIHMPEQDGVTYLANNFSPNHPPVMMLSSVSRENAELAIQALQLGASDYVEKPSLSNVKEKGEEIRMKLQMMVRFKAQASALNSSGKLELENQFKTNTVIPEPESKLRLIACAPGDLKRLINFLGELRGDQPPTAVFLDGAEAIFQGFCDQVQSKTRYRMEVAEATDAKTLREKFQKNGVFLLNPEKSGGGLLDAYRTTPASIVVYGKPSGKIASLLTSFGKAHVLVEDTGEKVDANSLLRMAKDVVPATSFAFMSSEYLSKLPSSAKEKKAA